MPASKKKRQVHEEHENHERWLVSYADFITLLFAFFVVLYSVSRVDNKRLQQASSAIKWALHNAGNGGIGAPPVFEGEAPGRPVALAGSQPSAPATPPPAELIRKRLEQKLRPMLTEPRKPSELVVLDEDGKRLTVRLATAHFFDPAQAVLRPQAMPVLDAIAVELSALHLPVRVEGHTDDSTAAGTRYRDNWELSAARAATVASYLEHAHAFAPELLSAAGFAASRPVASNATPEGREANRRIELVVEVPPGTPVVLVR